MGSGECKCTRRRIENRGGNIKGEAEEEEEEEGVREGGRR